MGLVVTGISQTPDVGALESALQDAGLSLEHIQVVEPIEVSAIAPHGLANNGKLGGLDTGTGVPGLTTGTLPGDSGANFFRDESLADRLSDYEIPDDEIENYIEALAAGRSIIAYFAKTETIDQVETAFRTAGLAKVKRF